jgi:signal transduction histidine kinase/CheY-like chemotaxis protein
MTPHELVEALQHGAVAFAPSAKGDPPQDFVAIACNAEAARLLGRPRAEIVGTSFASSLRLDATSPLLSLPARVHLHEGAEAFTIAGRPTPDDTLGLRLARAGDGFLLTIETGTPSAFDAGAVASPEVSAALEASEVGVWEYWPGRDRARWCRVTRRIYGLDADKAEGAFDDFRRLVAPWQHDQLMQADADLRRTGACAYEWLLVPPGHPPRWVQSRTRVVDFDAQGMPERVLGVSFDVSETRALQDRLEESRRAAEAEGQARSRFLATMSHEIRTPLNGLLGTAEVLDRALAEPAHRRMIEVIRDTGSMVLTIINDILDAERIAEGRVALEEAPFSPLEIARRVEAAHLPPAADKGLRLTVEADAGAAAARMGDPHRVMQILHNLVGNALKFTEHGAVTLRVRAADGEPVRFEVHDTGVGMTPEQVARAFDRFSQAETGTARRYGGSGLGLSIVKGLAEAMGGGVTLVSSPGAGATVRVELPLPAADASDRDRAPREAPPPPRARLRRVRVLAADDNEINRLVLSQMLDALGAEARIEPSGEALLTARPEAAFDLILLDIVMPGMDGPSTLARLRHLERARGLPSPPAVAFTANVMPEHVARYHAHGFAGHLAKPVTMTALADTLAAHAATD